MNSAGAVISWTSRLRAFAEAHRMLARAGLFFYVLLVACPIRYWSLGNDVDPTWRFALNYAPAHGYEIGRDYVYTTGPLAFLMFPENIGSNLKYGLIFQACLWLVMAAIVADVFFRGGFRIRNLALFSFFFGLAAPWFWFNTLGPENLILAGALLLLVMFQLHGGWMRYTAALLLIGLLPLFKFSSALIGVAAIAGFLAARLLERRLRAWPEILLGAVVPLATAFVSCYLLIPSPAALLRFLRGSMEVMSGYSSAMSLAGPQVELILALEALAVLATALFLQASTARGLAGFYALLFAGPLFVTSKHGFVRQDNHISNFFCFVALALALVSFTISLNGARIRRIVYLSIAFCLIWQGILQHGMRALAQAAGFESARMLVGALSFNHLRSNLDSATAQFPDAAQIEPELVALIGNSPVASLSNNFINFAAAGLQIALYPSVQRFGGYTPYLDDWNADWIRNKGPKFLVFDGASIDHREPWAETPAMWLEVYRWYDTRLLGPRNLLLERRATPRFNNLEVIGQTPVNISTGELKLPPSDGPVFWTAKCNYSTTGAIRKLLARIPEVTISIHETGGTLRIRRVIPEVLVSPVMGSYLPDTLAQFAAVFQPGADPGFSVDRIQFGDSGGTSYLVPCQAQFMRLVR